MDVTALLEVVRRAVVFGTPAGLAMALAMRLGAKAGRFAVDLPLVDGRFFFRDRFGERTTYALGLLIHVPTSIGLAASCFLSYALLSPRIALPAAAWTAAWTVALWAIFGLTVSPVVGLGWFGAKAGRLVWLELLATHAVYGLALATLFFRR